MERLSTRWTNKVRPARAPLNYRRGMFFLKLAIEQVRSFDSSSAEFILKDFLEPLDSVFAQSIEVIDYEKLDRSAQRSGFCQQWHGDSTWDFMRERDELPVAPPGFGLSELGLDEAVRSITSRKEPVEETQNGQAQRSSRSLWSSESLLDQLSAYKQRVPAKSYEASTESSRDASALCGSASALKDYDYGPIAPPKPSDVLAARKARGLATSNPYGYWTAAKSPPSDKSHFNPGSVSPSDQTHIKGASNISHWWEGKASVAALLGDTVRRSSSDSTEELAIFQSNNSTASTVPKSNDSAVGFPRQDSALWSFERSFRTGRASENPPSFGFRQGFDSSFDTECNTEHDDAKILETREKYREEKSFAASATTSSWAKIAAIDPSSSEKCNPHITLTLASPTTRPSLPIATATPLKPRKELPSAQLRVVWLAHLPSFFEPRHVSEQITEGPIMSILLQSDAHETLPGLSACVIFMNAIDAATFLENNKHCAITGRQIGPSKYSHYFSNDSSSTGKSQKLDINHQTTVDATASQRKDIIIMQGSPYPMDVDTSLQSMLPPTNARRRLKWSRSRLFYDVSIRQFKRDVMSLIGSKINVELFHFYNPGECTVVFSSVGVAAACLAGFEPWKRERANRGDSIVGAPASEITTLEEEGRAGGMMAGRMDGKKGRYEGVDVAYVRDFNEAKPESLWSQYGKDGRLKASSRMEGCEGLFEGPEP